MPPVPGWFKPKIVIEHVSWFNGQDFRMEQHRIRQERLAEAGIQHHLILNDEREESLRRRHGVRGGLFSRNQFVNERIFRPLPGRKLYDAIYIARLRPFKRHELAKRIRSLMVLTDDGGDVGAFCPEVRHAKTNTRKLKPREVAALINRSKAGLCLSEEEGAVRASVEMLLCGIPVVSTPSRGGRHVFLDDENSVVVPPTAADVARGVETLASRAPAVVSIRDKVLSRLVDIRKRYCQYLSNVVVEGGGPEFSPDLLYRRYFAVPRGIEERLIPRKQLPHPRDLDQYSLDTAAAGLSE